MEIKTKFNIGDIVYYSYAEQLKDYIECPDCLGSGIWELHLPNGETHKINCGSCSNAWESVHGKIYSFEFLPRISKMTIGQVRFESNNGAEYMCNETGIGSGSIYKECDLFDDSEAALEHAKQLCTQKEQDFLENWKRNKLYNIKNSNKHLASLKKQYREAMKEVKKYEEALGIE